MSISTQIAYWALAAIGLTGAVTVVFTRDVARMVLGLGAFLLAVAGWFLYFSQTFLAIAEVFVYVGGVLVLVLFAIMLVQRSEDGSPGLESRHGIDSATAAVGVFVLAFTLLKSIAPSLTGTPQGVSSTALAKMLLGEYLPQFEMAGVLLLAALVAAIVIAGGDDE